MTFEVVLSIRKFYRFPYEEFSFLIKKEKILVSLPRSFAVSPYEGLFRYFIKRERISVSPPRKVMIFSHSGESQNNQQAIL